MKVAAGLGFAVLLSAPAFADDAPLTVTLKDHKFSPAEVEAPANKPFALELVNGETAAAEFEGKDLKFEKVAPAGGKATVRIRAMKPGRYMFVDEYHEDVAIGYVVVK